MTYEWPEEIMQCEICYKIECINCAIGQYIFKICRRDPCLKLSPSKWIYKNNIYLEDTDKFKSTADGCNCSQKIRNIRKNMETFKIFVCDDCISCPKQELVNPTELGMFLLTHSGFSNLDDARFALNEYKWKWSFHDTRFQSRYISCMYFIMYKKFQFGPDASRMLIEMLYLNS